MVAGTQYRHFVPYIESIKRVQDGTIGKLVSANCYYNTGLLWSRERQPAWSDLEFQMRNWLYYTWLSGDHLVEQAIHNVDTIVWAFNAHPVRAVAIGGRQTRTEPIFGHIYDHFTIDYEFADGSHCMMMCRQQDACDKKVANEFVGTEGTAFVLPQYYITGQEAVEARRVGQHRSRQRLRPGAHRLHREHPRRQAAQRAEAGHRKLADRRPRPRSRLHRPEHHLGPDPQREAVPDAPDARTGGR